MKGQSHSTQHQTIGEGENRTGVYVKGVQQDSIVHCSTYELELDFQKVTRWDGQDCNE